MALDLILSAGAILAAYALQPRMEWGWRSSNEMQPGAFVAALTYPWIMLLTGHIAGLHDPLGDRRRWLLFMRVTAAVGAAIALYLFVLYWVSLMQLGRAIMIRALVLNIGFLCVARLVLWMLAKSVPRKLGMYGAAARIERVRATLNQIHAPHEVVACSLGGTEKLQPQDVVKTFSAARVDEVLVFSAEDSIGDKFVWKACLKEGIQVSDYTVFVEREFYRVPCEELTEAWILSVDLKWIHPFYLRFKRLLDLGVALIVGVLGAPLVVLAAILIWLEDGGPVFYGQTRTGFRGKDYRMWKLRSMRQDAEREGARWASRGDARVTRIGLILRRTRIDELPQIWNVVRGDMSFIGPRPERPEFVEQLTRELPLFPLRHWVKPGITGWAQINYPYGASIEDARQKLSYDLYYIKHASLLLDLHIVLRTIGAVMKGSR